MTDDDRPFAGHAVTYPIDVFPWQVCYDRYASDPGGGIVSFIFCVSRSEAERWALELTRYADDIGNIHIVDRVRTSP